MSDTTETPSQAVVVKSANLSSRSLSPINEYDKESAIYKSVSTTKEDCRIFHKDADIIIKVGPKDDNEEFKIIWSNVASASDAFARVLLNVNSKIRGDGTMHAIEVTDHPTPFAVLMNIIHYNFAEVPKRPTIDELYDICLLVSKYDCANLIQPWADCWATYLVDFATDSNASLKNHKALWVAWVLGCVAAFQEMADSLVLTSKVNKIGDLIHTSNQELQDLVMPQGLLDGIVNIRLKTLENILEAIRAPLPDMSKYCKIEDESGPCGKMMFGSVCQTLLCADLLPVPVAKDYLDSIISVKEVIYSIYYEPYIGEKNLPHKAHTGCNLGLKSAIGNILRSMESPVKVMHLRHLAQQAQKTGVDNGDTLRGLDSKLVATAPEFKPTNVVGHEPASSTVKSNEKEEIDATSDIIMNEEFDVPDSSQEAHDASEGSEGTSKKKITEVAETPKDEKADEDRVNGEEIAETEDFIDGA